MTGSLDHLRKMKRRATTSMTSAQSADLFNAVEKVTSLEKTLSVFRAEVDMKLKIMQQILAMRNEQVSVQKNLLEREQSLYCALLGHWENSSNLAASGVSLNFSAAEIMPDLEIYENLGPKSKKSKSSLRRQRRSGHSGRSNEGSENGGDSENLKNEPSAEGENVMTTCHDAEWTGDNEANDQDDDDWEGEEGESDSSISPLDDDGHADPKRKKVKRKGRPRDPAWNYFIKKDGSFQCVRCKRNCSGQANRIRKHYERCFKVTSVLSGQRDRTLTPKQDIRQAVAVASISTTEWHGDGGNDGQAAPTVSWESMLGEEDVHPGTSTGTTVENEKTGTSEEVSPRKGFLGRPRDPVWNHFVKNTDDDSGAVYRICMNCNKKVIAQAPRLRKHYEQCSKIFGLN